MVIDGTFATCVAQSKAHRPPSFRALSVVDGPSATYSASAALIVRSLRWPPTGRTMQSFPGARVSMTASAHNLGPLARTGRKMLPIRFRKKLATHLIYWLINDVKTLAGLAVLAATFSLAACSSASNSSASAPSRSVSASAAAPTSPGAPTTAPALSKAAQASATPSPVKTVPMQTASGGEFASPTGNITCEVHATLAYCQTGTPAQSVKMGATGKYTTCKGQQCLGNTGDGTPTLAYGTETGVGPFHCESTAKGVSCITTSGKGFLISTSGVTPA